MKKLCTILWSLSPFFAVAQLNPEVSNHEFNNWVSDNQPEDWGTFGSASIEGGIVLKEETDIQNGAASLKLETPEPSDFVNYSLVALGETYYDSEIHRFASTGEDYTARPDSVWILYKYTAPESDSAGVAITLQASAAGGSVETILNVLFPMLPASEWGFKSYRLSSRYTSTSTPEKIFVSFISSASRVRTPGALLQVDGVYFNNPAGATSLNEVNKEAAVKVYPNPLVGNMLHVTSAENLSDCALQLFDASGRKAGTYGIRDNSANIESLAAGQYFWLITSKSNELVAKGRLSVQP